MPILLFWLMHASLPIRDDSIVKFNNPSNPQSIFEIGAFGLSRVMSLADEFQDPWSVIDIAPIYSEYPILERWFARCLIKLARFSTFTFQ